MVALSVGDAVVVLDVVIVLDILEDDVPVLVDVTVGVLVRVIYIVTELRAVLE